MNPKPMNMTPEPPNILIVDDTPANLQLLTGMLKGRGCKVRPVPSGPEALQAVQRIPPDLILLDINMPGMSGYDVCKRIKEDPKLKDIPVLFISALSETADKVKAFSAGGVDYVTKPFQLEEVQARVETHLRLRQLRSELEKQKRQLQESYRGMFENSVEGIYQSSPEGRYLAVNPALARMYGYDSPQELLSVVSDIQQQIYVDPCMWERFKREIEKGDQVKGLEYQVRRRDGRAIWIRESARVVRDTQGAVHHYEGFIEDITQRKESERALRVSQQQLLETSHQIGMAEMATGVLHNMGNALNSIGVSATVAAQKLGKLKVGGLTQAVGLMRAHEADLGDFITRDPHGRHLPEFLGRLAEHLAGEQSLVLEELGNLRKGVEHVNGILTVQQNYARMSSLTQAAAAIDLVEDALRMNAHSLEQHGVQVSRDYAPNLPEVTVQKHKVLQILMNLIRNARYACDASGSAEKRLTLRLNTAADGRHLRIEVADNGIGIPSENLTRIFDHGFTTRKDGHGFGLHSGVAAAKEMGGSLTVQSGGAGKGATFILEFPLQPSEIPAAPTAA
jgi:PAS domain S-box-containing protein